VTQFSGEQRQTLLDLARHAICATLRAANSSAPLVANDSALLQLAGCFVSLHELHTHRLRGCVGRIDARESLAAAVRDAAASVLRDPRFTDRPVTILELPSLQIEITVLSPLAPVAGPLEFDPLVHGIYLTIGAAGGCFLPQVARDTGWTRQQLLERLCVEKLGMPALAWKLPQAKLCTFTTEIIGPEPFEPAAPGQAA
jgi:AmmeMemoRadiSam system protein A